jgi:hypothetical protein
MNRNERGETPGGQFSLRFSANWAVESDELPITDGREKPRKTRKRTDGAEKRRKDEQIIRSDSFVVCYLCASVSTCGSVISFASFSLACFVSRHLRKAAWLNLFSFFCP